MNIRTDEAMIFRIGRPVLPVYEAGGREQRSLDLDMDSGIRSSESMGVAVADIIFMV